MRGFLLPAVMLAIFGGLFGVTKATDAQDLELSEVMVSLEFDQVSLKEALDDIEGQTDFTFAFSYSAINPYRKVSVEAQEKSVEEVLKSLFKEQWVSWGLSGKTILLKKWAKSEQENRDSAFDEPVEGQVTDAETGETLPGVNILVKGTTIGTSTDQNGNFGLTVPSLEDTLVVSFVGYQTQEVPISGRSKIDVQVTPEAVMGEEMVVVGYGTQEAADVTGSISSADIEEVDPTDVSVMQSLHGSIPGLNIGQVDQAGEDPSISIRGTTSLSGVEDPLIVVDDVIYRGSIIDLNPSDIESVDILKDASATAVYGSQASNGVIVITTTKSGGTEETGPVINFSSEYAFQKPWRELRAQSAEEFMEKIEHSDIEQSRTEESGYTEQNPDWSETTNFKTNHEIRAFNANQSFDWYDWVTADSPYTMKHNMSIANQTETSNYYASVGYTEQQGHIRDEGYDRINARLNLSSSVTNWFDINLQSSMAISNYAPQMYSLTDRYYEPYAHPYEIEDGEVTDEFVQRPTGNVPNPFIQAQSEIDDRRLNLFGNIIFDIDLPLEGLSYKGNLANSFRNIQHYYFGPHENEFQGGGHKNYDRYNDLASDHILSFERTFNDIHDIDVTLLYGVEKRKNDFTNAAASNFDREVLGYNRLQDGESDQHSVGSGGWEELSLYSMGRINYAFNNKYLLTATLRRDGFSGFREEYKFGYFPSISLGWILTEESFFNNPDWLSQLKLRASYGATGNRTIDRYETLATISLGNGYVTGDGSSILIQNINSLESPFLKWEKTTGIDIGVDFELLEGRISGTIDYYNKNTTDLLYNVDIPGMTGYDTFPDNLGEIHNNGFEIELSSINVQRGDFRWNTDFTFSRNRNEIQTLLGFDINGDGKEDNLVSEGLFIGEPIDAIYDYEIDGHWQLNDEIPDGYQFGSYKVADLNEDGEINSNDRTILGTSSPAYRFGIQNRLNYKSWALSFFIHSIQGGNNRYLGEDTLYGLSIFNTETHFNDAFPEGLDYWTPSNTDARYQRPGISGASGISGTRYASRSFVRLQNVRLSYNFNPDRLENWGIQNLNLFISGKNLATWTNWNGWDPETGTNIDNSGRPVMRSYTLGFDVSL